jgi:hypothetical protein
MSSFMTPPGRGYDFSSFAAKPKAYIVCYDLKAFSWNYNKLFDELNRSLGWWHFLDRTWIIIRNESLEELSTLLLPLIYQNVNDSILIMPAKGPAAGMLPQEAWEWIRQNVPNY